VLRRALAQLLIAVALLLSPPPPGRATSDDTLVVVGGTLIDGTGRAPRPTAVIVIRAGVIREVTTDETSIPADARRVEARQGLDHPGPHRHARALPGLVDG
jgi:hypothetical protein